METCLAHAVLMMYVGTASKNRFAYALVVVLRRNN
jgi:hypothetical protein